MARFIVILAGLLVGSLLTGPAAANTIASFFLDGIFRPPSGPADEAPDGTLSRIKGTFSLDLTLHTVASASITTTDGAQLHGTSYSSFPGDTYGPTPVPAGTAIKMILRNSASAAPPISGQILTLIFGPTDLTELPSMIGLPVRDLPTYALEGDESVYFFLCVGPCASRPVGGFVQTTRVTETPIPSTLPLLATALGGVGIVGWRRGRRA